MPLYEDYRERFDKILAGRPWTEAQARRAGFGSLNVARACLCVLGSANVFDNEDDDYAELRRAFNELRSALQKECGTPRFSGLNKEAYDLGFTEALAFWTHGDRILYLALEDSGMSRTLSCWETKIQQSPKLD